MQRYDRENFPSEPYDQSVHTLSSCLLQNQIKQCQAEECIDSRLYGLHSVKTAIVVVHSYVRSLLEQIALQPATTGTLGAGVQTNYYDNSCIQRQLTGTLSLKWSKGKIWKVLLLHFNSNVCAFMLTTINLSSREEKKQLVVEESPSVFDEANLGQGSPDNSPPLLNLISSLQLSSPKKRSEARKRK